MSCHRRRRGSAYVEALVVTALFTFLWIGVLAFGRLYRVKLATLFNARADAWSATASACGAQPDRLRRALDELAREPDAAHARAVLDAAAYMRTQGEPHASTYKGRGLSPFGERQQEASVQTVTCFACNEAPPTPARDIATQRWLNDLLRGAGR